MISKSPAPFWSDTQRPPWHTSLEPHPTSLTDDRSRCATRRLQVSGPPHSRITAVLATVATNRERKLVSKLTCCQKRYRHLPGAIGKTRMGARKHAIPDKRYRIKRLYHNSFTVDSQKENVAPRRSLRPKHRRCHATLLLVSKTGVNFPRPLLPQRLNKSKERSTRDRLVQDLARKIEVQNATAKSWLPRRSKIDEHCCAHVIVRGEKNRD